MKKPDQRKVAVELFEQVSDSVANMFTKFYFGKDFDSYWVAEEIGWTLSVNDHFFTVSDMVDYFRHEYTPDQMFDHYDYDLKEVIQGKSPINIKNWKKINK